MAYLYDYSAVFGITSLQVFQHFIKDEWFIDAEELALDYPHAHAHHMIGAAEYFGADYPAPESLQAEAYAGLIEQIACETFFIYAVKVPAPYFIPYLHRHPIFS